MWFLVVGYPGQHAHTHTHTRTHFSITVLLCRYSSDGWTTFVIHYACIWDCYYMLCSLLLVPCKPPSYCCRHGATTAPASFLPPSLYLLPDTPALRTFHTTTYTCARSSSRIRWWFIGREENFGYTPHRTPHAPHATPHAARATRAARRTARGKRTLPHTRLRFTPPPPRFARRALLLGLP